MSVKSKITISCVAISLLFVFIFSGMIFENNRVGYYQVKQAAISGDLTARMTPGWYWQWFGDISTYKAVATVGFGEEKGEGSADIDAISVIFNDGSKAQISGLVRVSIPRTQENLIILKKKYAGGYEHFIQSGIVPIVTNAVKLSANLRSAQDAYTTLALFQQAVEDQLRNGIYKTRSDVKEIIRSTGETEKVKLTEVVTDKTGEAIRVSNVLKDLDCSVEQCVISVPKFDKQVEDMIAKRKDEAMKTELAKQAAIRAQQDRLTIIEEGKAKVAKVRYEKEQEKIAAVTEAEKKLEVAKLDRKAASEYKAKRILEAEADATYKKKVMVADGALSQKLKTYEAVQEKWAKAFSEYKGNLVPSTVFGSTNNVGGGNNGATQFMSLMTAKAAKDLALNVDVK